MGDSLGLPSWQILESFDSLHQNYLLGKILDSILRFVSFLTPMVAYGQQAPPLREELLPGRLYGHLHSIVVMAFPFNFLSFILIASLGFFHSQWYIVLNIQISFFQKNLL